VGLQPLGLWRLASHGLLGRCIPSQLRLFRLWDLRRSLSLNGVRLLRRGLSLIRLWLLRLGVFLGLRHLGLGVSRQLWHMGLVGLWDLWRGIPRHLWLQQRLRLRVLVDLLAPGSGHVSGGPRQRCSRAQSAVAFQNGEAHRKRRV
jgi:hypothetical protein